MEPLTTLTGPAAVLPLADVDTDVIIRIERLTQGSQDDIGKYAFEALRYREDGSEDPDFPLNREKWRNAPILLTGANFGCGSSREGAVIALAQLGIRVIVAPSFGDIFHSNCFQNGVLPVSLPRAQVKALMDISENSGEPFTVDLTRQLIIDSDGGRHPFDIDPRRKEGLLAGLDDVGLTMLDEEAISAWQEDDRKRRPWIWETVENEQSGLGERAS